MTNWSNRSPSPELVARLRAILRRAPTERPVVLTVNDLVLDPGSVTDRSQIARYVWGTTTAAGPTSPTSTSATCAASSMCRQRAEQLRVDYAREGDTEFVEDAYAADGGLLGGQSWVQLLAPNGALVKTTGDGLSIAPVFGTDMVRSVLSGGTRLMTVELGDRPTRGGKRAGWV